MILRLRRTDHQHFNKEVIKKRPLCLTFKAVCFGSLKDVGSIYTSLSLSVLTSALTLTTKRFSNMGLKYGTPLDGKRYWIENRMQYVCRHIKEQSFCPLLFWDIKGKCFKRDTRAWDKIVDHLVSQ